MAHLWLIIINIRDIPRKSIDLWHLNIIILARSCLLDASEVVLWTLTLWLFLLCWMRRWQISGFWIIGFWSCCWWLSVIIVVMVPAGARDTRTRITKAIAWCLMLFWAASIRPAGIGSASAEVYRLSVSCSIFINRSLHVLGDLSRHCQRRFFVIIHRVRSFELHWLCMFAQVHIFTNFMWYYTTSRSRTLVIVLHCSSLWFYFSSFRVGVTYLPSRLSFCLFWCCFLATSSLRWQTTWWILKHCTAIR